MQDIIMTLVILVTPLVLHFGLLLGFALLDEIATPIRRFDRFYNQYPWMLGVISGLLFASAYVARAKVLPFFTLLAVGLIVFTVDAAAAAASFYSWVNNSRRRNRRR